MARGGRRRDRARLARAARRGLGGGRPRPAVQGNLDPASCSCPWEAVEREARRRARPRGGRPGHVFNLGHGVLPEPIPDCSTRLVELVASAPRRGGGVNPAVILMAYGSPDRLSDVPAYYADIRGGRPIAPEHLDDLVARYRALGVGESDGAVAAERDHGGDPRGAGGGARAYRSSPGCATGSRGSRTPSRPALADGADLLVGLVLAPHYSSLSIGKYRGSSTTRVGGRAESRFVERWGPTPGSSTCSPTRVARHRTRTSSSPRIRCRPGSSTKAIRTATSCSRRPARRRAGGARRLVVLVPERVADRRALARAGHPRPPRGAHGAASRMSSSARSASSPTTSRSAGTSTTRRRRRPRSSVCGSSGSRCRTPTPVRPTCSRGSSGAALRPSGMSGAPKTGADGKGVDAGAISSTASPRFRCTAARRAR